MGADLGQRLRDVVHARVEVPAVVRLLGLRPGGDVLQVGCGSGVALGPLRRHLCPASLVGIDLHHRGLLSAPGHRARADLRALPFCTESFDLVVDLGTCQHLPDVQPALAEIARVLRPDGVFVHELPLAQLIAHPAHFRPAEALPRRVAGLRPLRRRGLWASHVRD